ncbi:MAG: hypothetical protein NC320_00940 [Clostridium sp.]|nr:hypothetical protein [Clostridium sp.]
MRLIDAEEFYEILDIIKFKDENESSLWHQGWNEAIDAVIDHLAEMPVIVGVRKKKLNKILAAACSNSHLKMKYCEAVERLERMMVSKIKDLKEAESNIPSKKLIDYISRDISALDLGIKKLGRTGEWIPDGHKYNHCSECHCGYDEPNYATPYCPNCGAKMEGKNE